MRIRLAVPLPGPFVLTTGRHRAGHGVAWWLFVAWWLYPLLASLWLCGIAVYVCVLLVVRLAARTRPPRGRYFP